MMLKLSVLLCLLAPAAGYLFSYDGHLYPTDPPFGGTVYRPFPMIPTPCPTFYYLFTRQNPDQPQELCIKDHKLIGSSCFDATKETFLYVHGMLHTSKEVFGKKLCKAILKAKDVNFIMMDWGSCSWNFYIKAVQQSRMLGADLAYFIGALEEKYGYSPGSVNLIADDFSCHTAGRCGRLKKGIRSITCLDATAPMFDEDPALHLTQDDAQFVQAYHTDCNPITKLGFGMIQPIGHMDIYMNGAIKMPECPPSCVTDNEMVCLLFDVLGPMSCANSSFPTASQCRQILGDREYTLDYIKAADYSRFCSHYQAGNYYLHSIWNPDMHCGCECDSVEECMAAEDKECPKEKCTQLGFHAKPPSNHTAKLYYLNTQVLPVLPYLDCGAKCPVTGGCDCNN